MIFVVLPLTVTRYTPAQTGILHVPESDVCDATTRPSAATTDTASPFKPLITTAPSTAATVYVEPAADAAAVYQRRGRHARFAAVIHGRDTVGMRSSVGRSGIYPVTYKRVVDPHPVAIYIVPFQDRRRHRRALFYETNVIDDGGKLLWRSTAYGEIAGAFRQHCAKLCPLLGESAGGKKFETIGIGIRIGCKHLNPFLIGCHDAASHESDYLTLTVKLPGNKPVVAETCARRIGDQHLRA